MSESAIQVLGGKDGDVIITRQYHDPKKESDAFLFSEEEAWEVADQLTALLGSLK